MQPKTTKKLFSLEIQKLKNINKDKLKRSQWNRFAERTTTKKKEQ